MQDANHHWITVPVSIPRQGLPEAVIEGDDATVGPGIGVRLPPQFRVRRLGEPREIRQSPYYPDPAAALLVLRLAHPDHGVAGWRSLRSYCACARPSKPADPAAGPTCCR